jgi:hypothetical protein
MFDIFALFIQSVLVRGSEIRKSHGWAGGGFCPQHCDIYTTARLREKIPGAPLDAVSDNLRFSAVSPVSQQKFRSLIVVTERYITGLSQPLNLD